MELINFFSIFLFSNHFMKKSQGEKGEKSRKLSTQPTRGFTTPKTANIPSITPSPTVSLSIFLILKNFFN